jgi:hypothetical protein
MVLEKIKPTNKAKIPLAMVNKIIAIQPNWLVNIALQTKLKTITRALQAIKGAMIIETMRSLRDDELRAIIMDGTLHPKPVNKFTTLRPLIPNRSNVPSNNTEIRDNTPICWIKLTQINRMTMTGIKVITVKKPLNSP